MSITWTISHAERLVIATGRGEVTAADMLYYVEGLKKEGAISYRKLLDLTGVVIAMPQADVRALGARFTRQAGSTPLGPSAVVVSSSAFARLAQLFDESSQLDRPLRIFRDSHLAREWLDAMTSASDTSPASHLSDSPERNT